MISLPVNKHAALTGGRDHGLSGFFSGYPSFVGVEQGDLGSFVSVPCFFRRPFVQQEISGALRAVDSDCSAEMFCFQRQSFIPPLCWHRFFPPEGKPPFQRFVPWQHGVIILDIIRLKLRFRRNRKECNQ